MCSVHSRGEGNLHPNRSTREYLNEYTSRGKPKIPPADRILMDFGHKARKNLSDNTDLVFQAIGPALHIMQLQLVDEASRFHLGRQRQQLRSSALALCYSAAGYCAPVWSRSAHTSRVDVHWTRPCISSLVLSVLHLFYGFQCSPTLNCQPYEGRLPLTSWWRKSSNMTVGQSSLIYLAHHCYDWHPGSRCG